MKMASPGRCYSLMWKRKTHRAANPEDARQFNAVVGVPQLTEADPPVLVFFTNTPTHLHPRSQPEYRMSKVPIAAAVDILRE